MISILLRCDYIYVLRLCYDNDSNCYRRRTPYNAHSTYILQHTPLHILHSNAHSTAHSNDHSTVHYIAHPLLAHYNANLQLILQQFIPTQSTASTANSTSIVQSTLLPIVQLILRQFFIPLFPSATNYIFYINSRSIVMPIPLLILCHFTVEKLSDGYIEKKKMHI